jgi:hypothetical protein
MKEQKLAVILCSAVLTVLAAKADVITGTELENASYFGTLGQLNPKVMTKNKSLIGPNACVPTATIDGLIYLENYAVKALNEPDPFATSPNSYPQLDKLAVAMGTFNTTTVTKYYKYLNKIGVTITLLAPATAAQIKALGLVPASLTIVSVTKNTGGTFVNNMYNGLQSYLSKKGANPAPRVILSGQQMASAVPKSFYSANGGKVPNWVTSGKPTTSFLATALDDNDGVEMQIQWGTYKGTTFTPGFGAHELTLDYISLNTATDKGEIGFLDPEGSATKATALMTPLSLVNGYLYFSDPADITDNELGDGPGAAGDHFGRITSDIVEGLAPIAAQGPPNPRGVPDGASTLFILGAAIIGLAAFARHARSAPIPAVVTTRRRDRLWQDLHFH